MKICIFGGTFNPIHKGHIDMAKKAIETAGIDRLIFLPSGDSYLKSGVLDSKIRFHMVKLAINEAFAPGYKYRDCHIEISDMELKRQGHSYTCDTIKAFKELFPRDEIYFLTGEDTILSMHTWRNPEYIFDNSIIISLGRGHNIEASASEVSKSYNATIIPVLFDEAISSTDIRNHIYDESFVSKDVLNDSVYKYIMENDIYR